jgi:hypothetical protein
MFAGKQRMAKPFFSPGVMERSGNYNPSNLPADRQV